MSTPNKYAPASNTPPPLPTCPHCKAELPTLALFSWQMPSWVIMSVYCPNQECRAVLYTQVLPLDMQPEASRIEMPS